jgi:hypothetical protein
VSAVSVPEQNEEPTRKNAASSHSHVDTASTARSFAGPRGPRMGIPSLEGTGERGF